MNDSFPSTFITVACYVGLILAVASGVVVVNEIVCGRWRKLRDDSLSLLGEAAFYGIGYPLFFAACLVMGVLELVIRILCLPWRTYKRVHQWWVMSAPPADLEGAGRVPLLLMITVSLSLIGAAIGVTSRLARLDSKLESTQDRLFELHVQNGMHESDQDGRIDALERKLNRAASAVPR